MGENTNQIEHEIEAQRSELGKNLQELETKAKAVTDWRTHFEKNPMAMIGVAFGGGLLLATMVGGRRRSRNQQAGVHDSIHQGERTQVTETWEHIKGALAGVASTKVVEFLNDIVPGFQDHFGKQQAGALKTTPALPAGNSKLA